MNLVGMKGPVFATPLLPLGVAVMSLSLVTATPRFGGRKGDLPGVQLTKEVYVTQPA